MPYSCAKAVCATFCYQIAGALIPLFGPDFPSECISPGEPRYGIMIIKPELITDTMRKSQELYQRYGNWGGAYTSSPPARRPPRTVSSRPQERHHYQPYPNQDPRDRQQQQQRVGRSRREFYNENSFDTRPQLHGMSAPMTPANEWTSHQPRSSAGPHPASTPPSYSYPERAPHRSAWTAVNHQPPSNSLDRYSLKRPHPSSNEPDESALSVDWSPQSQAPNPWLTAIPRSPQRTAASSPLTSQPGSANRSRAGSISSMASQQHPQRLPSPSSLLPSPSSSLSSLASSNFTSPRPQLPPISKLCSLPAPSGRRRLPDGRPFRVVGNEETTAHAHTSEEQRTRGGVYQFSAGYQRALTPPSATPPRGTDWSQSQRRPAALHQHEHEHIPGSQQPRRIAVEANMDCGDDNDARLQPLSGTPSSTSLADHNDAKDTNNSYINRASNAHGRDEGQTSLAARKTAALTLLHLRQQEEEKEAAAAAAAAMRALPSSSSLSSFVSPPPTSGQPSPTLSAVGTTTPRGDTTTVGTVTTTTTIDNNMEPSAPPPSPSSHYLGSPTSTSIASPHSSSACNTRESSMVAPNERSNNGQATAGHNNDGDADADDEDDYEHEQEHHRRKRRRLLLIGRAKSF
ncbi:hypothetical protein SMACR_01009 [Sordaria macrospora]|uniref:Uncharacterized protein n=1 Tax=Sordaria macrospora TaxID=5147 RepID=A0A8S8ZX19_SORMA|nr:hypothetical protein SMACR_01009 [Sordaria macrospora]WPJ62250.1 hypothetical protein SMAC4_01009 [Sordaria macrospora]